MAFGASSKTQMAHMKGGTATEKNYSLSHIDQITDFLDFLHEYCEEKSETFPEF